MLLEYIQEWYTANCDDSWEHTYGIRISTIDNPGWSITIDLSETGLEDKEFKVIDIERTENDWVYCKREGMQFKGHGGPQNLTELLTIFKDLAS